jgi:hypothetical protein
MTEQISKPKIECDFRQISNSGSEETRAGRYSQSMHWEVENFGSSKWVVLGYIDINWANMVRDELLSEKDIIFRILNHLNTAPEKKKYQKKEPEPKYGKLEPYKADFKIKDGKQFIIAQFLTNQHDNPNFWGDAPIQSGVKVKKTKRDPEEKEVDALAA